MLASSGAGAGWPPPTDVYPVPGFCWDAVVGAPSLSLPLAPPLISVDPGGLPRAPESAFGQRAELQVLLVLWNPDVAHGVLREGTGCPVHGLHLHLAS